MNFCIDCRWFREVGTDIANAQCDYVLPGQLDPMSGGPAYQRYRTCAVLRRLKERDGHEEVCGEIGRFFEPKNLRLAL